VSGKRMGVCAPAGWLGMQPAPDHTLGVTAAALLLPVGCSTAHGQGWAANLPSGALCAPVKDCVAGAAVQVPASSRTEATKRAEASTTPRMATAQPACRCSKDKGATPLADEWLAGSCNPSGSKGDDVAAVASPVCGDQPRGCLLCSCHWRRKDRRGGTRAGSTVSHRRRFPLAYSLCTTCWGGGSPLARRHSKSSLKPQPPLRTRL